MYKNALTTAFLFIFCSSLFAQQYSKYFTDEACRVDFHFCGNAKSTAAYLDKIIREPLWGGRHSNLSGSMNLGEYRFQVLDSMSNQLIYSDEFSTLYFEWQSTPEANLLDKTFEQSIQFPYPLNPVKLVIEKRMGYSNWKTLLQMGISPGDKLIRRSKPLDVPVKTICKTAEPDKAIDIVVIAEGYTAKQQAKFFKDAQKLADNLFTHEPFAKYKPRINIYAVAAVSADTGVSLPQEGNWRNSALGSHYYTFYSDRYLTTPNVFTVRDYAALVPYDAIYILTNTKTYGGGGIFNFYALAAADSKRAQTEVTVHEFGHSFAGLADEYFREGSDVLDGMYDLKEEPWEPNISSLVLFDKKWKSELPAGTVIPTPLTDENKAKIGVFEGGGYLTKGMYRPYFDCRMRTNTAKAFCPVCEKAVEKRILFLTENP
ncbi:MAG TPA: M64 family metallopeptidase [Paludibacter sp.]|nr:M64 family metallopeptidase [Paludibacter sp.]